MFFLDRDLIGLCTALSYVNFRLPILSYWSVLSEAVVLRPRFSLSGRYRMSQESLLASCSDNLHHTSFSTYFRLNVAGTKYYWH